jgi:Flp pilus assembly protein TadG
MTRTPHRHKRTQAGAVGIEFAFVFVIFFGVFYAILSYAFVTLLYQGLTHAASEGARSALKLDPALYKSDADYETASKELVTSSVKTALNWLPQGAIDHIASSTNGIQTRVRSTNVTVNTSSGAKVVRQFSVTVLVTYPNYAGRPLLPLLTLPGLGSIPNVPTDLVGSSTVIP